MSGVGAGRPGGHRGMVSHLPEARECIEHGLKW